MSGLLYGSCGSDAGPYSLVASTLPSEPSPRPRCFFLEHGLCVSLPPSLLQHSTTRLLCILPGAAAQFGIFGGPQASSSGAGLSHHPNWVGDSVSSSLCERIMEERVALCPENVTNNVDGALARGSLPTMAFVIPATLSSHLGAHRQELSLETGLIFRMTPYPRVDFLIHVPHLGSGSVYRFRLYLWGSEAMG